MYVNYPKPRLLRNPWFGWVLLAAFLSAVPASARARRVPPGDYRPGCLARPLVDPQLFDDDEARLHDAALLGDLVRVKRLVDEGAPLDQGTGARAETPLMVAAACGQFDVVEYLIGRGAAVDRQARSGRSALMWASKNGHLDVVQLLLSSGANPTLEDLGGNTARHLADRAGHRHVVDALSAHRPGGRRRPKGPIRHFGFTPGVSMSETFGRGKSFGFYLGQTKGSLRAGTLSTGLLVEVEHFPSARRIAVGYHARSAPYGEMVAGSGGGINLAILQVEEEVLPLSRARTTLMGPEIQTGFAGVKFRLAYLFRLTTDAGERATSGGMYLSLGLGF